MNFNSGNADGIGNVRKEELYQASAILKVMILYCIVYTISLPELYAWIKLFSKSSLSGMMDYMPSSQQNHKEKMLLYSRMNKALDG